METARNTVIRMVGERSGNTLAVARVRTEFAGLEKLRSIRATE